ncbi:MAG: hypothetical protein DHS20C18_25350 [Saprospiraceae bacterium]|nr:MAG: hypothetical protein DHS20C18_25350 [Saprospiraceae bacterium]
MIFVKKGSNGNGTSWASAYGDLQSALTRAQAGDQIWVAYGTYVPTANQDRKVSFVINDGIEVYGGFEGNEIRLEDRNTELYETILSGEIGSTSTIDDNSYTIIYTEGVSESTIVDGFTIRDGMANGFGDSGNVTSCGAAWFNNGSNGKVSSPTIRNCNFENNYAREGGALYNYANAGACYPYILACNFVANKCDFDGGAIFNDGNYGICSPIIKGCYFIENESTYGSGILNRGNRGEAKPIIENCIFAGNVSIVRGAAIYNNTEDRGICEPIIKTCRFEENASMVKDEVSTTSQRMAIYNKENATSSGSLVIRATTTKAPLNTNSEEKAAY